MRVVTGAQEQTLAIDFDNTIAGNYDWPDTGSPEPKVAEQLTRLKDVGFKLRIFTCRPEEHYEKIRNFMEENGIPFDDLVPKEGGKPHAFRYIDDKAVAYVGDWSDTVDTILSAWEQRKKEAGLVSARQVQADGYGGVDHDGFQEGGKTEPDRVGPDVITPNQKSPNKVPRSRAVRRIKPGPLSSRQQDE